jgi:hypothetical protein
MPLLVKPDLDTVKYLISKPSADGDASGYREQLHTGKTGCLIRK